MKQKDLYEEREKSRSLRQEFRELRVKIATLASINEVLVAEKPNLESKAT